MSAHLGFRLEWRGAVEATLQGLINVVSPVLLFVLLLGPDSLEAGMWATLMTASVVPAVALLLRGHRAILSSARIASLAVYIGLVLHLCQAMGFSPAAGGSFTLWQLSMGLAAASAMFVVACLLVMLAGVLKFGTAFKMIPTPVTAGISNGIAVVLVMLSLQQLTRSAGVASITACAMVACYFGWPALQRRLPWLSRAPAIVACSC